RQAAPPSSPVLGRMPDVFCAANRFLDRCRHRRSRRGPGLPGRAHACRCRVLQAPPLTTNQIDVAGGGVNASMFSAIGRGLPLKIVAGISGNGAYSSSALVVRRELIDSGRVKDYPDLKGLRIALLSKSTGLRAESFPLLP